MRGCSRAILTLAPGLRLSDTYGEFSVARRPCRVSPRPARGRDGPIVTLAPQQCPQGPEPSVDAPADGRFGRARGHRIGPHPLGGSTGAHLVPSLFVQAAALLKDNHDPFSRHIPSCCDALRF